MLVLALVHVVGGGGGGKNGSSSGTVSWPGGRGGGSIDYCDLEVLKEPTIEVEIGGVGDDLECS